MHKITGTDVPGTWDGNTWFSVIIENGTDYNITVFDSKGCIAFGFIAQWIFGNSLRVGYAIDFSTTNLRNYNDGTHEIMVSYELNTLKELVTSPRYF